MRFAPPIVALVDPTRRLHRRRDPVRVGVVPWPREQDRTTIVVKATYSFEAGATKPELVLAEQQRELTAAGPCEAHGANPIELSAPTDLVGEKLYADVILTGHAYAPQAQGKIDAHICVRPPEGEPRVELSFSTVGPSPIERMPLHGEYLRDIGGEVAIPPVGPLGPRNVAPAPIQRDAYGRTEEELAEKAARAGNPATAEQFREFDPEADPMLGILAGLVKKASTEDLSNYDVVDLAEDADEEIEEEDEDEETWADLVRVPLSPDAGKQFSSAQLCCEFLAPDDVVEIRGLTLGGEAQELQLPNEVALVVLEGDKAKFDVEMEIDTLVLDTDSAQLSLTWRGQVPEDVFCTRNLRMLVCIASRDDVPPLRELYRSLPLAHFFRAEVPAEHVHPDGEIRLVRPPDVALQAARARTLGYTPEPRLSLDDYALLAAKVTTDKDRKQALLEANDFDETDWLLEERGWAERAGKALQVGDMERVAEINRALTLARRKVAAGLEEFVE